MKKNKKSVVAMLGVSALVLLYLTTLITAFLDIPNWDRLFQASLVATIGVPVLLWIYMLAYKRLADKEGKRSDD